MKHLLFLDLKDLVTEVQFPTDITGTVTSARIITWNFEGQKEVPLGQDGRTSSFYLQIKFEGCLETRTVSNGSRPDMFPLPLRSFNDWAPTTLSLPMPVRHSPWIKRFKVSLWGEGETPAPFDKMALADSLRLLLWIEIETTP